MKTFSFFAVEFSKDLEDIVGHLISVFFLSHKKISGLVKIPIVESTGNFTHLVSPNWRPQRPNNIFEYLGPYISGKKIVKIFRKKSFASKKRKYFFQVLEIFQSSVFEPWKKFWTFYPVSFYKSGYFAFCSQKGIILRQVFWGVLEA